MANFNAGVRFNDEIAKYMSFEYDTLNGTCVVHIEGNIEGEVVRMKGTITSSMWEFDD